MSLVTDFSVTHRLGSLPEEVVLEAQYIKIAFGETSIVFLFKQKQIVSNKDR